MLEYIWLLLVIVLGLLFDYINGFHDTANSIATTISTRALKPKSALLLAAVFNFTGALSGTAVANTIGQGLIKDVVISAPVISIAFLGAIIWNLLTWYWGLPSSSSHALIGALVGVTLISCGINAVNWFGLGMIFLGLILTPLGALLLSYMCMHVLFWLCRNSIPRNINNIFRRMQIAASCLASFAHGSNDAQKSMGIITLCLLSMNVIDNFQVPFWVKLTCASAMSAGTAAGGKRIIKTLGTRIFKIEPINGFAADLSSGLIIYTASIGGFPASTTHVVSSAIMGAGLAKRWRGVRLKIGIQMLLTWLCTIPLCLLLTSGIYLAFVSICK